MRTQTHSNSTRSTSIHWFYAFSFRWSLFTNCCCFTQKLFVYLLCCVFFRLLFYYHIFIHCWWFMVVCSWLLNWTGLLQALSPEHLCVEHSRSVLTSHRLIYPCSLVWGLWVLKFSFITQAGTAGHYKYVDSMLCLYFEHYVFLWLYEENYFYYYYVYMAMVMM